MPVRLISAVLLLSVASTASAAPSADVIQRLLGQGNVDGAMRKCDAWDAVSQSADSSLREACAAADWERTALVGTVRAWSDYRVRWKGTTKADAAREVEGQKALLALGMGASEQALLELAKTYAGADVAHEARRRAAQAAVRAVRTADDAARVVADYPQEPEAVELTQRFLEAFVTVDITDTGVEVSLKDTAVPPEGKELGSDWVVRSAAGAYTAWPDQLRTLLVDAGLSEDYVAARLAAYAEGGERLPVCYDAGLPEGAQVGVLVSLGRGTTFVGATWEDGCGPDAPPVVVGVKGGAVSAIGLSPEHTVTIPVPGEDHLVSTGMQLLAVDAIEEPTLVGGFAAQAAGTGRFVVTSLASGETWWWATPRPPPGTSLQLSAQLRGETLPEGWRMSATADQVILRVPNHDEPWVLPATQAATLSPLVQRVTGVGPMAAPASLQTLSPPTSSPWLLPPAGGKIDPAANYGPAGSQRLDLARLDDAGIQRVRGAIEQTGVATAVARAYSVQLDDDPLLEAIAVANLDGRDTVVLVDPPAKGLMRIFPIVGVSGPVVGTGEGAWMAFRASGRPHVAWTVSSSEGERLVVLSGGERITAQSFAMPLSVMGR